MKLFEVTSSTFKSHCHVNMDGPNKLNDIFESKGEIMESVTKGNSKLRNINYHEENESSVTTQRLSFASILKQQLGNKHTYIFWDIGSCPIPEASRISRTIVDPAADTTIVTENIASVVSHCTAALWSTDEANSSDTPLSVTRLLFTPFETAQDLTKAHQYACIKELTSSHHYRVVPYNPKSGAEVCLRAEIDSIIGEIHTNRPKTSTTTTELQKTGPLLCFIVSHATFSSLVACLKLEQLHNIVLVHSASTGDVTCNNLTVRQLPWSVVRRLHSLPVARRDKLFDQSLSPAAPLSPGAARQRAREIEERAASVLDSRRRLEELDLWRHSVPTAPAASTSDTKIQFLTSVQSADRPVPQKPKESSQFKLDLKHSSLAAYFRRLIEWRPVPGRLDKNRSKIDHTSPLFGETSEVGYPALCAEVADTAVAVEAHPKGKKYYLVVSGLSNASAEKRSRRLGKMIEGAVRNRQIHELPGWQSQHRLAIADSDIIARQQEVSRACVLFHYSGPTSLAEIVALQPHQHNSLLRYLQKLRPREVVWEVPERAISWYGEAEWEALRSKFAVHVELLVHEQLNHEAALKNDDDIDGHLRVNVQISTLSSAAKAVFAKFPVPAGTLMRAIKVFGFSSIAEQALEHILRRQNGPVEDSTPSPIAEPVRTAKPSVSSSDCPSAACKYHGSYSFQDREAGIFFQAFEPQFRDYLERACGVTLDPVPNKPPTNARSDVRSADSLRNSVFKAIFHGATQASVTAARSYLEQLSPANLVRTLVFYPQVRAAKYKELVGRKTAQQSVLSAIRARELACMAGSDSEEPLVDLLTGLGFVNIRIKPPMHTCGIRRMSLPADCTVTVCGSAASESQAALLRQVEDAFRAVGSEYLCREVSVSFAHPLKKQLTVRAEREAFVQHHGLVGLKWEEGSRLTGSVGTAKLWAASQEAMDSALSAIRSAESGDAESVATAREGVPLYHDSDENSSLTTSHSGSEWRLDEAATVTGVGLQSTRPVLKIEAAPPGLQLQPQPATLLPTQSVVYWPDPCLRFVVLCEPLRGQLSDVLFHLQNRGLVVQCPHSIGPDLSVGVQLAGESAEVAAASRELSDFLAAACRQLCCAKLLLTRRQFEVLQADDDLSLALEEKCGVQVAFCAGRRQTDAQTVSVFDLQLMEPPPSIVQFGSAAQRALSDDSPLLTVRVDNAFCGRSIEVAVISDQTNEAGWTWGTSSLLVFIDRHNLPRFRESDATKLRNGEVLVHTDRFTGRTILRVTPSLGSGAEQQAAELTSTVMRGVSVAEQLSLAGVAVAAPTDSESFPALSPDRLRALTVEAVMDFAMATRSLRVLSRIACIELPGAGNSAPKSDRAALAPGGGDRMAYTALALLLEQQRAKGEAEATLRLQASQPLGSSALSVVGRISGGFPRAHPLFPYARQPRPQSHMVMVQTRVPLSPTLVAADAPTPGGALLPPTDFASAVNQGVPGIDYEQQQRDEEEDLFYKSLLGETEDGEGGALVGATTQGSKRAATAASSSRTFADVQSLLLKGLPGGILLAVDSVRLLLRDEQAVVAGGDTESAGHTVPRFYARRGQLENV